MKNGGTRVRRVFGILAITLLGVLAFPPGPALSAWSLGEPIVAYFAGPGGGEGGPLTDTSAAQIAAGGWNSCWAHTVDELDIAEKYGLRATWLGAIDTATVVAIRNHPALYAYYVADEPSSSRFSELAATVSSLRTLDPDHLAYINLFPTYASGEQLSGTSSSISYSTYLSQYMSTVKPSLLSYDHYQFRTAEGDTPDYFKNLTLISHTAKQAGIPFMNVVQSSSWDPAIRVPNGNELRYLHNTSLAYGAMAISDFVYYYPGLTGGMALADGTTTELYDTAKTINPQFKAMAEQVQSLKHIGAYHLGDLPPGFGTTDGSSPMRLPSNSPFMISGITSTTYQANQPVRGAVLGLFGPDDQLANATHALVVNLDYSNALNTRVTGPGDLSVFDPTTGAWIAQGHAWADVTLEEGGAVLVGLTALVPEPSPCTMCVTGVFTLCCCAGRKMLRCH